MKFDKMNLEKALDDCQESKVYLDGELSEFSFVLNHKVYHGYFYELDDEKICNRIMSEFVQVSSNWYIQQPSKCYKYAIWNGMEYELSDETLIYSQKFYTEKEFKAMCREAQKEIDNSNFNFDIAVYLCEVYDFSLLKWGYTFNIAEDSE